MAIGGGCDWVDGMQNGQVVGLVSPRLRLVRVARVHHQRRRWGLGRQGWVCLWLAALRGEEGEIWRDNSDSIPSGFGVAAASEEQGVGWARLGFETHSTGLAGPPVLAAMVRLP
jgi:hypothetical protein